MIEIKINNQKIDAEVGTPILKVAKSNQIPIPHICFHPALKPSGSCKLCGVEVKSPSGKQVIMLACILKVKDGLNIQTDSPMVRAHRQKAFNALLALAPGSRRIRDLAKRFDVPVIPEPNGCIRCRLCIRVCKEIVKAGALKMEKTGQNSRVTSGKGLCIGCGTCANLCPTGAIRISDHDNVRTVSIRDEVISRLPLERCDGCGSLYATSEFLAHVAQNTGSHPHTKQEHHLCPGCAKLMSDRAMTEEKRIKK